jgi:hypothetical protein
MVSDALPQFIKAFLNNPPVPKDPHCSDCGALLVYVLADFWLYGSEKVWTVPLPFCSYCEKHSSVTH